MKIMGRSKKKPATNKSLQNRKARHDYQLGDDLVVGLQLTGAETKALRRGQGHIRGAYVQIKHGELWLINATITGDHTMKIEEKDQTRDRKLLAKQKEIDALTEAKKQGLSIVPIEVLNRMRYIKLRIATGRGKKKYDKRETIKRREQDRSARAAIKYRS